MPAERSVKISGAGVPQPHRAIGARRCKKSTVGAEGDTGDAVRVAAERGSNTSGHGIPQPHRTAALPPASISPSGLKAVLNI